MEEDIELPEGDATAAELARCSTSLSEADAVVELAIAFEMRDGLMHLVDHAAQSQELGQVLANADRVWTMDPDVVPHPSGYTWEGEGIYVREAQGATLEIAIDFRGIPIGADAFALSSYALDPTIELSPGGVVEVHHAGPGPLAPVLDLPGELPNPLVIGEHLSSEQIAEALEMTATSIVVHEAHRSTSGYEVVFPRGPLTSEVLRPTLVSGSAESSLGQTAELTHFALEMRPAVSFFAPEIEGEIRGPVRGGTADFQVTFDWENTEVPLVRIACL